MRITSTVRSKSNLYDRTLVYYTHHHYFAISLVHVPQFV